MGDRVDVKVSGIVEEGLAIQCRQNLVPFLLALEESLRQCHVWVRCNLILACFEHLVPFRREEHSCIWFM